MAALPVHEDRSRDARRRGESGRGAARRRPGDVDALARLGARGGARRDLRDAGRAERLPRPEPHGRAADLRLRGRRARWDRLAGGRDRRRADARGRPQPARDVRRLRRRRPPAPGRPARDPRRPARKAVRALRAQRGEAGVTRRVAQAPPARRVRRARGRRLRPAVVRLRVSRPAARLRRDLPDRDHRAQHPHRLHRADLARPRRVHGGRRLHDRDPDGRLRRQGRVDDPDRGGVDGHRRLPLRVPALRLSGLYLALATFAIAVSTPAVIKRFEGFTGGGSGINLFGLPELTASLTPVEILGQELVFNDWLYYLCWTIALVAYVLAWLFLRGRTGLAFRARPRQRDRGAVLGRQPAALQDARVRRQRRLRGRRGLAVRDRDDLRQPRHVPDRALDPAARRGRRRRPRLARRPDRRGVFIQFLPHLVAGDLEVTRRADRRLRAHPHRPDVRPADGRRGSRRTAQNAHKALTRGGYDRRTLSHDRHSTEGAPSR